MTSTRLFGVGFLVFFLAGRFASVALAHEVRPAYLQLRQTSVDTYDLLWKVPGTGSGLQPGIHVELPEGCLPLSDPHGTFVDNAYLERWSFKYPGGLSGNTVRVSGFSAATADVLVRVERLDGTTQVVRLTPSTPSFVVEAEPRKIQVALTYLRLGIGHILTGIDHLLYILALLFLVKGWRRMVATLTAFTVAHSLTLAAAALGWVHVPQPPVEACIALSILFVAREIVRADQGHPGLTGRWPWVVSFTFGLLHGFGFAGALSEVGLPQNAIPTALLFFNLGVEIGQLLFVAGIVALLAIVRRVYEQLTHSTADPRLAGLSRFVPPYAIGSVAAFWLIQRIAAF